MTPIPPQVVEAVRACDLHIEAEAVARGHSGRGIWRWGRDACAPEWYVSVGEPHRYQAVRGSATAPEPREALLDALASLLRLRESEAKAERKRAKQSRYESSVAAATRSAERAEAAAEAVRQLMARVATLWPAADPAGPAAPGADGGPR